MSTRTNAGSRSRPSFTLVEMATVLATLGLILLLLSATLVGALRTHRLAAGVTHRLMAGDALADQFRADVARAAAAPRSLGRQPAGPTCLILRLPDDKHVVYSFRDGRLERSEAGSKGPFRTMSVGDDRVTVEFGQADDGRILTMRLVEPQRPGAVKRMVEISAALGGDLR